MGGKWEKYGESMQQCLIFCNKKKSQMEKVKKMGRSRECKVQEMGGLDPLQKKTFNYLDQNNDDA